MQSDVFETLLLGNFIESKSNVLKLDENIDIFEKFLSLIHTKHLYKCTNLVKLTSLIPLNEND